MVNAEQAAALRAPFPPEAIGKIPKGGTYLDYVGHAAVSDRLLSVDPEWTWNPQAVDPTTLAPLITQRGQDSVMWIELIVCGVTRLGVGIVASKSFELEKQLISDAIRNAAMRFGVALDLWSKEDLHANENAASPSDGRDRQGDDEGRTLPPSPSAPSVAPASSSVPKAQREKLKRRCAELQASGVSVADEREARHLPLVDSCDEVQFAAFTTMVDEMFAELEKPFEQRMAGVGAHDEGPL